MLGVASGRIIDQFFFGHLGDSNLHVTVDANTDSRRSPTPRSKARFTPLIAALSRIHLGRARNRTAEAESICITRAPASELRAMWAIKKALDPKGILNPGKVLPDYPD